MAVGLRTQRLPVRSGLGALLELSDVVGGEVLDEAEQVRDEDLGLLGDALDLLELVGADGGGHLLDPPLFDGLADGSSLPACVRHLFISSAKSYFRQARCWVRGFRALRDRRSVGPMRLAVAVSALLACSCSGSAGQRLGQAAKVAQAVRACDKIPNGIAAYGCTVATNMLAADETPSESPVIACVRAAGNDAYAANACMDKDAQATQVPEGRLNAACYHLSTGDTIAADRVLSHGLPAGGEAAILYHCAAVTRGCQRRSAEYLLRTYRDGPPPELADAVSRCANGGAPVVQTVSAPVETGPTRSHRVLAAIALFLSLDEPRGAALLLADFAADPSVEDAHAMWRATLDGECHPKSARFLMSMRVEPPSVAERAAAVTCLGAVH